VLTEPINSRTVNSETAFEEITDDVFDRDFLPGIISGLLVIRPGLPKST
jgi:hypothetical protein